jgi:hypothetical protein
VALRQRRHRQTQDVDAVVKVAPETALVDHLAEQLLGGHDHPHLTLLSRRADADDRRVMAVADALARATA